MRGQFGRLGGGAAKSTPANTEQGAPQKLASAGTQAGQLHSHAARQYDETAASAGKVEPEASVEPAERPSQSAEANKNWISDALFSDN